MKFWIGFLFILLALVSHTQASCDLFFSLEGVYPNGVNISAQKRAEALLSFEDGLIFQKGEELTTNYIPGFILVVDVDKKFYSLPGRAGYFHHDNFFGKETPVIFAGEIRVLDGVLLYLSNSSGHFKPNSKSILTILKILTELGIDLTYTAVKFEALNGSEITLPASVVLNDFERLMFGPAFLLQSLEDYFMVEKNYGRALSALAFGSQNAEIHQFILDLLFEQNTMKRGDFSIAYEIAKHAKKHNEQFRIKAVEAAKIQNRSDILTFFTE
ncbi:MAG: hypothetical protein JNM93_11835 [Bacteriovoracaceae bacterium]|nr:hypothetical protein [Bacteriovoracaceae bacterium]